MKKFCVVCFKIGRKITAKCEGRLCKDCFRDLSLRELGKEYNCVVCLQNGKKGISQVQGEVVQKVLLERNLILKNEYSVI